MYSYKTDDIYFRKEKNTCLIHVFNHVKQISFCEGDNVGRPGLWRETMEYDEGDIGFIGSENDKQESNIAKDITRILSLLFLLFMATQVRVTNITC